MDTNPSTFEFNEQSFGIDNLPSNDIACVKCNGSGLDETWGICQACFVHNPHNQKCYEFKKHAKWNQKLKIPFTVKRIQRKPLKDYVKMK